MPQYYVVTNSYAAPFFSDTDEDYVNGDTPEEALLKAVEKYRHPAGLYAANLYRNHRSKHKGDKPLVAWRCNHAIAVKDATKDLGCYTYQGKAPGHFFVNDTEYTIDDPKGGRIVADL